MPPHSSKPRLPAVATTQAAPASDPQHPRHPDWLARQVGAELRRLRAELGATAYELAVPGVLSDQAILNNERGKQNPGLKTLTRHCQRLGTTLHEVLARIAAATRQR